ncbi:MAG: Gfo/Idh/MocA family oxidoreductase [Cellvibrionaceae bacterium]|nr:Gfo/Idh/MocA family oxidoreductase [Cellvibrionaceae bacterium]
MSISPLRAGIVGAGYISEFHVKSLKRQSNTQLVSICDLNEAAAKRLAAGEDNVQVYTDLDKMLAEANLDVVHILTQPDSHALLAKKVLEADCHVLLEKPVTVNSQEAEALAALAQEKNRTVAVNHNFVFSRPFNALRTIIDNGELGPLKSIRVVWKKMLPQMNVGPWNLWMLREPGNILFETGSHSLSELLAVIGEPPEVEDVQTLLPKPLPSGSVFYRRWHIKATTGPVSIQIDTAFDQGYEQHFVEVEGMFGVARADIENDVFTVDQPTGRAYDSERFHINLRTGLSRARQALRTYGSYAASKFLSSATGAPYETSMLNGIANCYALIEGAQARKESTLDYAIAIAKTAEAIQAKMPDTPTIEAAAQNSVSLPPTVAEPTLDASVLIVGASGFIGKRLLLGLQDKGIKLRAIVRNASSLVGVDIKETTEIMVGDFRNQAIMDKALNNIETVYHLAVAHGNSLEGYIKSDVEPTKKFIEQCKQHAIKRFIYSGTIDSLYLGPGAGRIKESDGIDSQIKRRNNYAHSKSLTEDYLNTLFQTENFPVVIIRPAIVLGAGGPITHVGVANWFGLGRCAYWGEGTHSLPIVLVDDIAQGLMKAMDAEAIEGNTYNLSAEPCLSARDYVAEVEKVLGSKITAESSHYVKNYLGDMVKWVVKVLARHPDAKRIPSTRDWRCREQHASFDTSRAQKDLNWQPTNDRDTIIARGIHEPTRLFLEG